MDNIDAVFAARWDDADLEPAEPAEPLQVFRRLTLALVGTAPSLEEIRRELAFKRLAIDEDGEGLVWIGETQIPTDSVMSTPRPLATEETAAATSPVAPALQPFTEPNPQPNGLTGFGSGFKTGMARIPRW